MLYIYLNYTGNVSSYLIENRSLLNYKENSKLMQKKKNARPSQNGKNANKICII